MNYVWVAVGGALGGMARFSNRPLMGWTRRAPAPPSRKGGTGCVPGVRQKMARKVERIGDQRRHQLHCRSRLQPTRNTALG
jgi:hypothetical protein